MKEIKAIIQPFMADRGMDALQQLPDVPGVTVSEVRGFGRRKPAETPEKSTGTEIFGAKKVKLEIVVPDGLAKKVTELIRQHAHTGNPGDGKIFIYTVDDVIKVRTGESGEQAI